MRFVPRIPIGFLGVFALAAVGCSGSSPAQPPGDLPAAVTGRAVSAGSTATLARGAHGAGGVRRAIAGCSGSGTDSFVGGTDNNVAAGYASGVLSGHSNHACDNYSGIGDGFTNTINSSGSAENEFIGGGGSNAISGGYDTFIGGGYNNAISGGDFTFVGGGSGNAISSGNDAFIGGGALNAISSSGNVAFIGGGGGNKASGQYASILGGSSNTASGTESTVAGGGNNIASGYASFAAGSHADAAQGGSFVWSDSSSSSTTKAMVANQFVARTAGGVKFFSNSAMTTGVSLAAGGGSWASVSDRAVKNNVQAIDDAGILNKVASLPITQWSYISERGVRHVGPMAQDFYAAFGVGEDNKHITSIDEDGVALAAIKALDARLAQKDAALRALQRQVAALSAKVNAMR